MTITSSRTNHSVGIAVLWVFTCLTLAGCATAESDTSGHPLHPVSVIDKEQCEGVYALVDFGGLGMPAWAACVPLETSLTAIEVLHEAGIALEEGDAFPGSVCRVMGKPESDRELRFDGESYFEDCATLGPMWAYWALLHDPGTGWQYAAEGVGTQRVYPGESLAFVWQFGDTSLPRLPAV